MESSPIVEEVVRDVNFFKTNFSAATLRPIVEEIIRLGNQDDRYEQACKSSQYNYDSNGKWRGCDNTVYNRLRAQVGRVRNKQIHINLSRSLKQANRREANHTKTIDDQNAVLVDLLKKRTHFIEAQTNYQSVRKK